MTAALAGPLPDAMLDELAAAIAAGTAVAGIGEATRFSSETFSLRDQIFRRLARRHQFRALALQEHAAAAARLDKYVTTGHVTARSALDGAWGPWRTAEMAAALEWIREFNRGHPDDLVRIFGVKPAQAQAADYDAILGWARQSAPGRLGELAPHLDLIRTAHQVEEHVQRARGTYQGRPFAEHARDALAIVLSVPGLESGDAVAERMRLIVGFHEGSVAGRGSFLGDAERWADTISGYQLQSGARVAYWDGIVQTVASMATLGLDPARGPQPSAGGLLRRHYGARYVSVAIGFHHGDLGIATVPEPAADLVDAKLSEPRLPYRWLDLRSVAARRRWDGPAKVRVISGVYDPSHDAAEHMSVPSLAGAFDILVHIRQTSRTRALPEVPGPRSGGGPASCPPSAPGRASPGALPGCPGPRTGTSSERPYPRPTCRGESRDR
jgi:erythromycin esterase